METNSSSDPGVLERLTRFENGDLSDEELAALERELLDDPAK